MRHDAQVLANVPGGTSSGHALWLVGRDLCPAQSPDPNKYTPHPALGHLQLLSEDEIPQYSDVVLLLGQFRTALTRFHERFYGNEEDDSFLIGARWFTRENPPSVYLDDEQEEYDDEDNG